MSLLLFSCYILEVCTVWYYLKHTCCSPWSLYLFEVTMEVQHAAFTIAIVISCPYFAFKHRKISCLKRSFIRESILLWITALLYLNVKKNHNNNYFYLVPVSWLDILGILNLMPQETLPLHHISHFSFWSGSPKTLSGYHLSHFSFWCGEKRNSQKKSPVHH